MMWTIIVLAGSLAALAVFLYLTGRKYNRVVAIGTFAWATTHVEMDDGHYFFDDVYIGFGKPYRPYRRCTTSVHFADGGHCLLRGQVEVPFPTNAFIVVRQNVFGDSRVDRLDGE